MEIDISARLRSGRKVAAIIESELPAGQYKFQWNGLDYSGYKTASGIYFYKLESENFRAVKEMILLRQDSISPRLHQKVQQTV
ncbi:MAG: hypothetical protein IH931_07515 [candidate division Zixibacteria bacterium]|nr:hypothetical protein [candidate division Zixibacteria bacterium]